MPTVFLSPSTRMESVYNWRNEEYMNMIADRWRHISGLAVLIM